jgi:hypothetical protein
VLESPEYGEQGSTLVVFISEAGDWLSQYRFAPWYRFGIITFWLHFLALEHSIELIIS